MDQPPRKLLRPKTAHDCEGKERCPSNQGPKRQDGISCHGGMTSSASFDFADHCGPSPGLSEMDDSRLTPTRYARMTRHEKLVSSGRKIVSTVLLGANHPHAIQLTHPRLDLTSSRLGDCGSRIIMRSQYPYPVHVHDGAAVRCVAVCGVPSLAEKVRQFRTAEIVADWIRQTVTYSCPAHAGIHPPKSPSR